MGAGRDSWQEAAWRRVFARAVSLRSPLAGMSSSGCFAYRPREPTSPDRLVHREVEMGGRVDLLMFASWPTLENYISKLFVSLGPVTCRQKNWVYFSFVMNSGWSGLQ